MKLDDMIIVSGDDHIIEPADMFEQHVPTSMKSKAPQLLTLDPSPPLAMNELAPSTLVTEDSLEYTP